MHVTAIVLAAGGGLRFKSKISKPLIKINSQPAIIYSLNILSKHPYIRDIIVVVNTGNLQDIMSKIEQYRIKKIKDVVLGGRQRQGSVVNGLKAIDERTDLVLIHDAVRPFIDRETVSKVIKEAGRCSAAIVGVPVKATIKSVKVSLPAARLPARQGQAGKCQGVKEKFIVDKTLDRDRLWEIQTPQVFKKELIFAAYKRCGDIEVTDDASLVERLGVKIRVVAGSYFNIKITTPEDLIFATAIAKKVKA